MIGYAVPMKADLTHEQIINSIILPIWLNVWGPHPYSSINLEFQLCYSNIQNIKPFMIFGPSSHTHTLKIRVFPFGEIPAHPQLLFLSLSWPCMTASGANVWAHFHARTIWGDFKVYNNLCGTQLMFNISHKNNCTKIKQVSSGAFPMGGPQIHWFDK